MTIEANFKSYVDEDLALPVTIYEEDGTTPQNITGWSIEFVAHSMSDNTPLVSASTSAGTITINSDTVAPQITVSISSSDIQSSGMPPADYLFYIRRTNVGGQTVLTYGIWSYTAH